MSTGFTNFIKNYLAKIKTFAILLAILFITSVFFGYVLAHTYPGKAEEVIYKSLKNIIEPAKTYSSFKLLEFIFVKNLIVALTGIISGIFFGFIPILIIFINGLILGTVSYFFLEQHNALIFLSGIMPHGIFELPALFFSAASGLWLWQSIYRRILYDKGELGKEFLSIITFFILIIIPMLVIAAMIETFITPHILDLSIL